MKTIVVGDLHGRCEVVDWVLDIKDHNVVFIGDYLDSFHRSADDQYRTLNRVLEAAKEQPDRVTALMGNHELSYLEPAMRASGFNQTLDYMTRHRHLCMREFLKPYTWVDGYLISHAGISRKAIKEDAFVVVTDYLADTDRHRDIGRGRGGHAKVGGIYWCDWYSEFRPLDSVPQIVGHSGYRKEKDAHRGVITKQSQNKTMSYNIDCLESVNPEVLVLDDGVASVWDLNDYVYYDHLR